MKGFIITMFVISVLNCLKYLRVPTIIEIDLFKLIIAIGFAVWSGILAFN